MSVSILEKKSILAVDDEPDVLGILREEITSNCFNCTFETATSYDEAVRHLESKSYDLIILDIMGVRGFDLLEIAARKKLKAVMLTAHALSPENLKRARDMGAQAYLPKQQLGAIVPFLENALKYDFEPGWRRMLEVLGDVFTTLWGRDWEKFEQESDTKLPRN